MREKRTIQSNIFDRYAEHQMGLELKAVSDWLYANMDLLDWVGADTYKPPFQRRAASPRRCRHQRSAVAPAFQFGGILVFVRMSLQG